MSGSTPTKEEQIRILTAKVSQLESVCACIIEFFAREDTSNLSQRIMLTELKRHAQTHQGEIFAKADDTSFGQVAEHLRVGSFKPHSFGASGAGH